MKKKMLFVIAMVAAFALFVPSVMAAEYVAQIGTEKYETLDAAITNATNGDTVELLTNVTLTTKLSIDKDITISGNYTITSSATKIFEIHGGAGEDGITTVTFKDVTMVTSASNGRCVDTRSGDINLTLNSATLKTTGSGNNQPITIGNTYASGENNNVITLTNTTIEAGNAGYGIIVFNPITLNVTNSTISGYAALYFKGAVMGAVGSDGTVANITDSTLSVVGNEGFEFGAVVFEDNNVTVNVEDTTISADVPEGSAYNAFQWNALNGEYKYSTDEDGNEVEEAVAEISGNKVTVSGASEIKASGEGTSEVAKTESENEVVVEVGVTSDLEIPTEYLPEGTVVEEDENGNLVVVTEKVTLTLVEVIDGKVGEKETIEVEKGSLIDKKVFVKELKEALKEENLYLYEECYADSKLKTKFDFSKELVEDTTLYVSVKTNPETGDINLVMLIGTILVGMAGLAIVLRKRFAKVN